MGEIREFRIKGNPEETGVSCRRNKRAFDLELGGGENGIIFIEVNENRFVFGKLETIDVSPIAQYF